MSNPYTQPGIPGPRKPLDDTQVPPAAAAPTQTAQSKPKSWATTVAGAGLSLAWLIAIATWGADALFGAVFGAGFLLVLAWILGMPVYLIAARALADRKITRAERNAMFAWPVEVAKLALFGKLFTEDGKRQFAQEKQQDTDTSGIFASGWKAYAFFVFMVLVAVVVTVTAVVVFIDVLLTLIFLAFLAYIGGMLFYFWAFGLFREPFSAKLAYRLGIYPLDMFRTILGAV